MNTILNSKLEQIFAKENAKKFTENGDTTFNSTLNHLVDLLFMSEYFQNHLDEVTIGNSAKEKLFSLFIRDPRDGMGRRDFGRELMKQAGIDPVIMAEVGRYDDLLFAFHDDTEKFHAVLDLMKIEIENGNELVKKWMPRYSSKNLMLAREIAAYWGMSKQQYGHFIKCNTTENKLSRKDTESIAFEHVPSLAMLKYYNRFNNGEDTKERFGEYLQAVKEGKKDLKVNTTTVYDIYKNRHTIDPDVFFEKIEKISGSFLVVCDTSGSMTDGDAMGKALSIGHYLTKCSTYANNKVVTFSSAPQLLELGVENVIIDGWYGRKRKQDLSGCKSQYDKEIQSMITGDCSNTNFEKVAMLLRELGDDAPQYIVVLSDMEFDSSCNRTAQETWSTFMKLNPNTQLVWWNLNGRKTTAPEIVPESNSIFMSGYNPMLLKYLQAGFNGEEFLDNLLFEYGKKLSKKAALKNSHS